MLHIFLLMIFLVQFEMRRDVFWCVIAARSAGYSGPGRTAAAKEKMPASAGISIAEE
jgi:hypothetical protein